MAVANLQGTDVSRTGSARSVAARAGRMNRLSRLFDDILDMARIDAAAITTERAIGSARRRG